MRHPPRPSPRVPAGSVSTTMAPKARPSRADTCAPCAPAVRSPRALAACVSLPQNAHFFQLWGRRRDWTLQRPTTGGRPRFIDAQLFDAQLLATLGACRTLGIRLVSRQRRRLVAPVRSTGAGKPIKGERDGGAPTTSGAPLAKELPVRASDFLRIPPRP